MLVAFVKYECSISILWVVVGILLFSSMCRFLGDLRFLIDEDGVYAKALVWHLVLISANYKLDAAHIGLRQNDPRIKRAKIIK